MSATENEVLVRRAYEALARGERATVLALVAPDLVWTYLDPSEEDPEPQVCHGKALLDDALEKQQRRRLRMEPEEVVGHGENVLVVTRTPGRDEHRARKAADRNFHVLTLRDGHVVALRACRSREEALRIAGIEER